MLDKQLHNDLNNILNKDYPKSYLYAGYKDIRPEFMGLSDKAKLYLSSIINDVDFILKQYIDSLLWTFYILCIGYMYIDEYKDGLHIWLIPIIARDIETFCDDSFNEDDKDEDYINELEYLQSEQSFLYNTARRDIINAMGDAKCGDEYEDIFNRCDSTIPKDIPDILDVYNLFGENKYWIDLLTEYKPADYPFEYVEV